MAASKSNAWRLAQAVPAADKAAKVADMFAKWEPAPSRYVIFFAGPEDWQRWYGARPAGVGGRLGDPGQRGGHGSGRP